MQSGERLSAQACRSTLKMYSVTACMEPEIASQCPSLCHRRCAARGCWSGYRFVSCAFPSVCRWPLLDRGSRLADRTTASRLLAPAHLAPFGDAMPEGAPYRPATMSAMERSGRTGSRSSKPFIEAKQLVAPAACQSRAGWSTASTAPSRARERSPGPGSVGSATRAPAPSLPTCLG
jgi:hypothetical protein